MKFDPTEHIVFRDTSISRWLRREFPSWPLFVFWNAHVGTWEIGEWRGPGDIIERAILGTSLNGMTRDAAAQLRFELTKLPLSSYRNAIRQAHKSQLHTARREEAERDAEFYDYIRWFCRHTHTKDELLLSFADML